MKTKAQKQERLNKAVEVVLENLNLFTYTTLKSPGNIQGELIYNRQIVNELVDAARALGRDFSDVIR